MLVITDVTYYETVNKEDTIALAYSCNNDTQFMFFDSKSNPVTPKVVKETIHGRRYVDKNLGIDTVVGIKGDIARLLGMQYESYIAMHNSMLTFRRIVAELSDDLVDINEAGFWKRLKYLITGKFTFKRGAR